jgi:hypothetical protein
MTFRRLTSKPVLKIHNLNRIPNDPEQGFSCFLTEAKIKDFFPFLISPSKSFFSNANMAFGPGLFPLAVHPQHLLSLDYLPIY